MIKSKGTKIYGVWQIKMMAQTGFQEDFVDYLDEMPEHIKKMIMSWATDKTIDGLNALREYKTNKADYTEQESLENEQLCSSPMDMIGEQIDETYTESDEANMCSYYSDVEFEKRINVNKVYAKLVSEEFIQSHQHEVIKRHVVISYGENRKYGMILDSCDVCKELYIQYEDKSEFESVFNDINIEYEFYQ